MGINVQEYLESIKSENTINKDFEINNFREGGKNAINNILSLDNNKHYLTEKELIKIFGLSKEKGNKVLSDYTNIPKTFASANNSDYEPELESFAV